jgi:glycosyltransferase involved in cell wall biosynthesis
MKILFFINGIHPGGKERRMIELMKELKIRQEAGFELVVMNTEINYPEIFDLKIKIHYLIRKTKKDLSIFRKFYKICKEYKPDIVHCWDSMTAIYAIPVCKLLNIKLINGMVVDTPVKKNISNKNWLRAQLTFPFSNIVIGNSHSGLAAYNAPPKKSLCIYNGIDLNRFINLKEPNSIRKEIFGDKINDLFIIGMVAAFEVRKDYRTLIDAAIALLSSENNVRFILIGDGTGFNEIKNMVPYSLSNKIVFLGKRSNVESIINIFDVGILLTNAKVHGEGVSNSILEYMALGKPVIASRGGGTNEVIIENENGFLIDPNKKEQLVEKIELLMKSENCKSIGQRGKEIVQEKFNLKTMANNYSNIYRKLSAERKLIV